MGGPRLVRGARRLGALWAAQQGRLSFAIPPAEVVLAPVAGLAFTAALGLASFETDLRAYRFGWRQILSVVAAAGVVLGALPLGAGLVDGRWRTPTTDYATSYQGSSTPRPTASGSL